jgi:hypothetical protein
LGTIRRTRYYIPARTIWGVLISQLAPSLALSLRPPRMYREARGAVESSVRLTHLFPLICGVESPPKLEPVRGLCYGKYTEPQFENMFVGAQTSTALTPESLTAENDALHETEFLAPRARDGHTTLGFYGDVLLRGTRITPAMLWAALAGFSVGSDRRYGWGRLALAGTPRQLHGSFAGGTVLEWNGDDPTVSYPAATAVPAHVEADANLGLPSFEGDLEVVGGRDWDEKRGSGQSVIKNRLCWVPGTQVTAACRFAVGPQGIWKVLS